MGRAPEVSVVLVNFNDKGHLLECLQSLESNAGETVLETIVVDNNSSDGSPEFIRKHFPKVRLICNTQNLGYAKANNQGIRESRGEFVLLLNSDTICYPRGLDLLLGELKANPGAGAAGPALTDGRRGFQVSFGRRVSFFPELFQKCLLNPYYRLKLRVKPRKRQVGWLSGACLLSRRAILKEAGLFDENFFLYFEDIDLCLRIRQKGWSLWYLPEARFFHKGEASTEQCKLFSRYHYRRSQLYFYQKHTSPLSRTLLRLYLRLNFTFALCLEYLRKEGNREDRKKFFKLLKAV